MKFLKIISGILTVVLFCTSFGLNVFAAQSDSANITELLQPYVEQVRIVNEEKDSSFFIPEGNEMRVYNNIKNMTPEEFAEQLRYEADNYEIPDDIDIQVSESEGTGTSIVPYSDRADIHQEGRVPGYTASSWFYLDTEVFSVTGASGTYTYEAMIDYGQNWDTSYQGYHFEAQKELSVYYSGTAKKAIKVTGIGYPVDQYGIAQMVEKTLSYTFKCI